ncbi:MAG: UDP-N-acetylmuramoyl-tripeptide--D-alanyl-D-alanine ligase [Prevotellaceae bacterium]|nr:UDP-N-acetylmuramoyl-tripeptide--D-alanyl-D-alanine ligase [Prevotellaceae bacterium]
MENLYQIYQQHPIVCTDSRAITMGCLFFALKGERFNGNLFALQALDEGAAYAVVDDASLPAHPQLLYVDDVLVALQTIARRHRRTLKIPVIAITGTNGKTTTKEFIARVLATRYKIGVTQGNLNNHIGVPCTLLQMDATTQIGIVEMGANHAGEIAALCRIAKPDFGVITNIGKAHLEGFGSLEGVKKTKGELYDFLSAHAGTIFYDTDNTILSEMVAARELHTIRYGLKENAVQIIAPDAAHPFLRFVLPGYPTIETNLIGAYNTDNILAALAIGRYFNVPATAAAAAVNAYIPENNRSQLIRTAYNTVIMDAYNANPSSMAAAIENFVQLPVSNKMIILGDMLELGPDAATEHAAIIDLITRSPIQNVWLVGRLFTQAAQNRYCCFDSVDVVKARLAAAPLAGVAVLIKGSRGIGLEKLEGYL